MSETVTVALVQMNSGLEADANLAEIARRAAEARQAGAAYILTPEMSVVFAENRAGLAQRAAGWEGNPDISRLAEIARENALFLHIGSLAIALEDGRFANRSVLFAPSGEILATYDKIHLFDADLPGINAYRESATYAGGENAVLADLGAFTLGFSICYDMRFAALYRALAQAGAQVIAVPAAFTVPTGQAHWHVLLRARAIETGCFILAAAQGGQHANGRATYGHSLVVAPWGEVIAEANGDQPGLVIATLELDAVASARQRVPALANGRDFELPARISG
ncbi:carbon-nitrogen hydrolase family protein [Pelagibacterium sp. 26DY04]|uniref:carbon-nitrogen hydrolase family protein n=1 Tax=Pelagibacterium sp. 26DY04 TaxID=2967130 RepID=UPI00281580D3|nr:carbon-nitrogen hydrolase family protein [Pelagibacterium sp. 26DY04]WMT86588.1 carbon-nitrogen hydrolase family protein [Pelagibacterium sp. 26DY04]